MNIIVTSHLLAINGIFLKTLNIIFAEFRFRLREDNSCHCLLIDTLISDILLEQRHEVVVGSLDIRRKFSSIETTEIEPLECLQTWERFPFLLLHLLNDVLHLLTHKAEGMIQHLSCLWFCACKGIQTNKHLAYCHRHIERAWHIGPPRPGAVGTLQLLELCKSR